MDKKLRLIDRFSAAADILLRGTFTMPVSEWEKQGYFRADTAAGINVNAITAQKYSAVFGCIRVYEWVMASLPMKITTTEGGKLIEVTDGDYFNLLTYPNKYLNAFTFIGLMNARVQLYGNAVAVIVFNSKGVATELIPVEWTSVNVRLINGQPVYVIDDKDTGVKGTFLYWQVIHFKINSRNGWVGLSPLTVARESIGHGIATENFGRDFFKKGGNLKGTLETEGHISDAEFKRWKKRWDSYYGGSVGDHETPVLEYGMKYRQLGVSPNDAQFIESKIFQISDVARFFGTPPSLIGENTKNAFTSAEQQDIQFVKYSLSPLCKSQEAELEFKLMDRNNQQKLDIKYQLDWLLRGDMLTRSRYEQTLAVSGIMTRNEARKIETLPPLPGLDEPLNPAFLTGKQSVNQNDNKDANQ